MRNRRNSLRGRRRGFSLAEIVIVMAIISILTALTIVGWKSVRERSKVTKARYEIGQISLAVGQLYSDTKKYPGERDSLRVDTWNSDPPAGYPLPDDIPADLDNTRNGCLWNWVGDDMNYPMILKYNHSNNTQYMCYDASVLTLKKSSGLVKKPTDWSSVAAKTNWNGPYYKGNVWDPWGGIYYIHFIYSILGEKYYGVAIVSGGKDGSIGNKESVTRCDDIYKVFEGTRYQDMNTTEPFGSTIDCPSGFNGQVN